MHCQHKNIICLLCYKLYVVFNMAMPLYKLYVLCDTCMTTCYITSQDTR